jgi:hypothetical protein
MAEEYEYQKQRKIFGRYPMFEDTDSKIVGSIPPQNKDSDYVLRDPNTLIIDNIPGMSEHKVSFVFCFSFAENKFQRLSANQIKIQITSV